ncbi:disease resistance TIR-NBS-LRR class family protein [Tanacetum coccineum]
MSSNKRLRLSDPSFITPGASTSNSSDKKLRLSDDSDPSSITPEASTSSSSTPKSFKYDVFLSFRGEDTRNNFVGHLYEALQRNCIETYKDDEKIEKGERINDQLLKSIEDSRFYIIVFSKNYASSSWCLDELVKIMECQKMTGHTTFPVFYDVEPTQVRKQDGPVGEAFSKSSKQEAAGKWRDAMEEIGTEDVRMIGIKGIGGGGKTTLARAVYDQISNNFEGKSFVENVREVSEPTLSGLKKLQKRILKDVLNKQDITFGSVHDGKSMLKAAIIIITTRDEQVLKAHGVKFIHDVNLLSPREANCLFSRYAFQKEIPIRGYEELSEQVVQYANGLPLTIEVLGKLLCGKDKGIWVDVIKRLKEIPLKDTLDKLELSYNSLEDEHKQIFLDIVCMLKGKSREYAIRVLECCGFYAIHGLEVLEQRSLITLSPHEYGYDELVLGMHDHIEEMGKNIVRREHPDEPNKHSRLWITEEIEDILDNDMGTEETRCLKLYKSRVNTITVMKGLGKMKKLRNLYVNFEDFKGDDGKYLGSDPKFDDTSQLDESTQYFPNSLKYLKCSFYPFLYLPKTFQANNLIGLTMEFCSKMVQLWEEREKKILTKLKYLHMSYSKLITFDLGLTPNLVTFSVENCAHFVELHVSAPCPNLKFLKLPKSRLRSLDLELIPNLKSLELRDCDELVDINCPNLERLDLFGCTHFVRLQGPNLKFLNLSSSRLMRLDLELIPNLERLELKECYELVEINAPVGCLKKIGYFYLSGCLRFTDFEFFGRWEPKVKCSSATLDLVGKSLDLCPLHPNSSLLSFRFRCNYKEDLPSSVGNIEKLMSFGLCACTDLKKISDMICSFQCLKKLRLKCNIPKFPKDLGKLECLEELYLSSTKINHLPDSICMLKHLKYLTIYGALLEKLPDDLGRLECLEKLYVSSKKIEYLPDSICMLKCLTSLDVRNCCLGKLPVDIGQLESLERLALWGTTIKHLSDSICMLKHLKYLNLRCCALLEKLPDDLGLLECLEKLIITDTGISHLPRSIFGLKDSYWLLLIEDSCKHIMDAARTTNAKTMGKIPLPPRKESTLDLPVGVDVEVKL